jgi:hypothetical protein
MAPLNKDLQLTAEFLAVLRSGFFGQIKFESALSTLGSGFIPEGYLDTAHKAFDKIDVWMNDLLKELPIFATSWSSPETFDAISAMGFLRELKEDLEIVVPQLEEALKVTSLHLEPEAVKLLVAALVRSSSTRSSYAETLTKLFSQLKAPDLAQQVAIEIDGARDYVRVTDIILNTFTAPSAYEEELCEKLRSEASLTPCDFKALIHESNILLNVYAKEFTFDLAEIPHDAAQEWLDNNISPVPAGYWRAYEFTPSDFLEWTSVGITGAPLAANWRRALFAPAEAVEWIKEGLTPSIALVWRGAGFSDPARVAALLRRGVTDPAKAPRTDSSASTEDDPDTE